MPEDVREPECSGVHRENVGTNRAHAVKLPQKRLGEVGRGRVIGPEVEKTSFADMASMIETDYQVNGRKSGQRLHASLLHLREAFGTSRALARRGARAGRTGTVWTQSSARWASC
jgi:hypothetical protein